MTAMQRHPVEFPTVGDTACSRPWAREAASALIPLLILGSVATEALAGPAVLSDAQMDAITAANSGQQQHWLVAGERPVVEVMVDAARVRATALQDIRTAVGASVDTAALRDAAAAATRGATAAAADLRAAAGQAISTPPAGVRADTAAVREATTSAVRATKAAAAELRAAGQATQIAPAVTAATAGLAAPVATAVRNSVSAAPSTNTVAPSTRAAGQEIRSAVGVSDTAALRDAATAAVRATEAAASAVRAAEQGIRVPADPGTGTARVSQSVTSVAQSNGTVVKATARATASGTDRAIAKTFTGISLKN